MCWQGRPGAARLPGGPWLGRLRSLALSRHLLSNAASLATLNAAQQLQRLGVDDTFSMLQKGMNRDMVKFHDSTVLPIVKWAARHPALQLLALERNSDRVDAAAELAEQQRPGLHVLQSCSILGGRVLCRVRLPAGLRTLTCSVCCIEEPDVCVITVV